MSEELLDTGPPRRLPRSVAVAAVVVVAAAVVATLLLRSRHDEPSAAPSSSSSSSSAPGPPVPSRAVLPRPAPQFDSGDLVRDQLLSYVYSRAFDSGAAHTSVLSDTSSSSCEQPAPETRPTSLIAQLVERRVPHARVRDVSPTFDKFAGLCVVEVRANVDNGSSLVVRVVAPVEDAELVEPRLDHGAAVTDGLLVQFVRATFRSGWIVTVGTTGPPVSGPSQAALAELARDPDLLW